MIPIPVPTTVTIATNSKVEKILVVLPIMTLESISLPYRSVPRGCAKLGGFWAIIKS